MSVICDFHIHSKYSRATSKDMSIVNIAETCEAKGIDVVATSDFLHPGWQSEIIESLEESEPGLYKLKNSDCKTRFILSTEISSIYKKNGKVRKIHNLVILPSIESAVKLSKKIGAIGNIKSDGRPILGLDSKDLLEMTLETDENMIFIPAHIWTPWFSLFGSKSGFDNIEECFEDLTDYIFALETGLSSDPPMNWHWSELDRFTLVSNSDAHSLSKIAREATIVDSALDYFEIRKALQNKSKVSTIEFFPEEGKYHFDGHRKCNVCVNPLEAIELKNICPVCNKPLTIGVFHRILELADRKNIKETLQDFTSLIPLGEILSQILNVGVNTKKVKNFYDKLIAEFGNELNILLFAEINDVSNFAGEILGTALKKMRKNSVKIEPGYDGEYGRIIVVSDEDRKKYELKKLV